MLSLQSIINKIRTAKHAEIVLSLKGGDGEA